ncbi:MAG: hypothetical protein KA713_05420 [Chryseotalea sp. WA131a]|nr:MAG: hypothetical protein KA713_05420 [Chryseotalea sp. WA131a]
MNTVLNELIDHHSLTKETARPVLVDLASGKYNPAQMSSFMTVYMMRSIKTEELEGFRDAMLELCVPVKLDVPAMDVCGTGGDGKNTFNISLTGSFKFYSNNGEKVMSPRELGLTKLTLSEIKGGDTVENSAKLFMQILEGKGTPQQNAVVVANAGMALYCANQSAGIAQGMARAAESLTSGKALDCFKRLLNT